MKQKQINKQTKPKTAEKNLGINSRVTYASFICSKNIYLSQPESPQGKPPFIGNSKRGQRASHVQEHPLQFWPIPLGPMTRVRYQHLLCSLLTPSQQLVVSPSQQHSPSFSPLSHIVSMQQATVSLQKVFWLRDEAWDVLFPDLSVSMNYDAASARPVLYP